MPFPTHLGKYEIRRELGKGSMGVVYEGFDPLIERSVAVKIIRPDQLGPSQSAELLARLKREAQAVGRLNHPGVVAIYDYGEDASFGGTRVAFIAMELIDGKELKHYFDNRHRFAPADIARIMGEVLSALQHAHERGVTHRDVKPSNIILLRNGAVKIADFGVARLEKSELTQAGTMIGTPMYMSPEQILGMAGVDGRADIFSCGVMLYQFLTGEKPFTGSVTIVMQKVLNEDPPPPTQLNPALSPAWDAVVRKAMAKKPADRYQSASALADAIRAAAAVKGDEATVVLPVNRPAGATMGTAGAAVGSHPAHHAPLPVPAQPPAASPPPKAAPAMPAGDEEGTMFVRGGSTSLPPAAAPAGPPSAPMPLHPAPETAQPGPAAPPVGAAADSPLFGAGFGSGGTTTMRSASQAAASAAVTAALSGHRSPPHGHPPAASGGHPPPPPPPAPAPAPRVAAAAGAGTAAPGGGSSKMVAIGVGVGAVVLLLALGGWWLTRPSDSVPVATPAPPPPVATAPAPEPAPPAPPPADTTTPSAAAPAPTPDVTAAAPVPAPAPAPAPTASPTPAATPTPVESPVTAEWRTRVERLQAARPPLSLPAALGLLFDLPTADDRRVAAELESMLKARPPHSALALGVADGHLRFHWQHGLPSPARAEDAVLRRCRQLAGPNGGCAAVVVNGEFRRDAFTAVAQGLGTQGVPAVRNRFLRTLDRALAEQRAKEAPATPDPAVAAAPAPARPAPAPAPAPAARPVSEWADAVAQLRAAEGQLTLARGLELLLQVKDPAGIDQLAQLQTAVKRMRWKSAVALGERGGSITMGFANGERLVQWAEERAVSECTGTGGGRPCTVVAVDGTLRSGAFIEFAARLGGRPQAQVRETFLRDVQRALQAGI